MSNRAIFIAELFPDLRSEHVFRTPDDLRSRLFSIHSIGDHHLHIRTSGQSVIRIDVAAFLAAIGFLRSHRDEWGGPCRIGSRRDAQGASSLIVRDANSNRLVIINYVLPILAHAGYVLIDGRYPNTTWLI